MLIFLMGFFYALNYHFAVFSKMMHIKDTVEVATCCANYGCLSRLHFCSMSEICGCFGELGKRRPFLRSIIAETLKQSIRMKQTASIPATDINVVSKSSVLTMWLNRENQLFSSVLEESVSNRQVCLMAHASLAFSALVCAGFVSAVPALLCLAWFVVSLHLAWKGGLR